MLPARLAPDAVTRRGYQEAIAAECLERSTLVILPTGMGKTVIALLVLAARLEQGGRAIFLAPTKPLVEQHARFLAGKLLGVEVRALTGENPPEERELAWRAEGVVCSTPQVLANDLRHERADLAGVRCLVFDEAHRAVGEYAYVAIARAARDAGAGMRVLGMTASPGSDADKIAEVMDNLGIEGIEIRNERDPDVAAFVQPIAMEWLEVAMPPTVERIGGLLRQALRESVGELQRAGLVRPGEPGARDLLDAQRRLAAQVDSMPREHAGEAFQLLSALARALKLNHALELAETQGLGPLRAYIERLRHDPTRAARSLLRDARVEEALRLLDGAKVEHPKMRRVALLLQELLRADPEAKAIVFAHFRDTAEVLLEELARVEGLKPVRFVGQASKGEDKGMSQREQQRILDGFRAGEHNVLIATSVAEEGLDVPSTDLVVFYEPVPSEIRSIQRRGRTGRHRPGRVVVLLTKGTRDVGTYWSSKRKERAMRDEVAQLRARFARVNASWERPAGQRTLGEFQGGLEVDHRVANSPVAMALRALGVTLRPANLPGATVSAGESVGVRVVDAQELRTPAARSRLDAELKSLARFPRRAVVLVGDQGSEAEPAIRAWAGLGVQVRRARDASEAARMLKELVEAAA
ncbi:MAG: DEAD/DEAH box helicase [Halobacteriales archaeon]|nr:DEAD/DEAH box helicase [Halobacteriales archaeon]